MGRIAVLLADAPLDAGPMRAKLRDKLTPEQWNEIIAARERGVSVATIFARLSGAPGISWFFKDPKQLQSCLSAERAARKKAAKKK